MSLKEFTEVRKQMAQKLRDLLEAGKERGNKLNVRGGLSNYIGHNYGLNNFNYNMGMEVYN